MAGYRPGEQPQDGRTVKLNTNENPYRHSPRVDEAINSVLQRGLQRYPDPIGEVFRKAAGDVLNVPSEWIICGNGSDDILTILTRTFVSPGETIRFPSPSYTLYSTLAKIQNANIEVIPFTDDFCLSESFYQNSTKLKLVYLPNPNSPTGTVIDRAQVEKLASSLSCPLVVDEAYADFADFNCVDLVKSFQNVIVTRTLSKSYGLAGLRFGFGIAQPSMIAEMLKVKDSYNCDALSIGAATAAISDRQWFESNRSQILKTRKSLNQSLTELGFICIESHANFIWCNHEKADSHTIYEQLKQREILVRYMKYADWGDGLRISIGTEEQTADLLSALKIILA